MKIKKIAVEKVPSKVYQEVIRVYIPTAFFWNKDGSFDGIEFGPLPKEITQYQHRLLCHILDRLRMIMPEDNELTPVPDTYLKAFKEDKQWQ